MLKTSILIVQLLNALCLTQFLPVYSHCKTPQKNKFMILLTETTIALPTIKQKKRKKKKKLVRRARFDPRSAGTSLFDVTTIANRFMHR